MGSSCELSLLNVACVLLTLGCSRSDSQSRDAHAAKLILNELQSVYEGCDISEDEMRRLEELHIAKIDPLIDQIQSPQELYNLHLFSIAPTPDLPQECLKRLKDNVLVHVSEATVSRLGDIGSEDAANKLVEILFGDPPADGGYALGACMALSRCGENGLKSLRSVRGPDAEEANRIIGYIESGALP